MAFLLRSVIPTEAEIKLAIPGDDIVPDADVVMDRAFTIKATPEALWPWLLQLGKDRGGWYFTKYTEHFIFPKSRGIWVIDPAFQDLKVGDVIPDWGGKHATFEAVAVEKEKAIVYKSTRGKTSLSWVIILRPETSGTRLQFRLRIAPVRTKFVAKTLGGFMDALTINWLAAGLRARLEK